jgi:hypothetical protein
MRSKDTRRIPCETEVTADYAGMLFDIGLSGSSLDYCEKLPQGLHEFPGVEITRGSIFDVFAAASRPHTALPCRDSAASVSYNCWPGDIHAR